MKLFGTETIIGMMVSDKHEYGSIHYNINWIFKGSMWREKERSKKAAGGKFWSRMVRQWHHSIVL